jgi:hypothetical protein
VPSKPTKDGPLGPRDGISNHATRTLRDGTIIRGTEGATFAGFIPPRRIIREQTKPATPTPTPSPRPRYRLGFQHIGPAATSTAGLGEPSSDTTTIDQQATDSSKRAFPQAEDSSRDSPSPTKKIKPSP